MRKQVTNYDTRFIVICQVATVIGDRLLDKTKAVSVSALTAFVLFVFIVC